MPKLLPLLLFFISITSSIIKAQIISTVAGKAGFGYNGDNIAATSAELNQPQSVAVDAAGNIYIGDYDNYRIRKVNTSGIISTIAGNGSSGYFGDGGPATNAEINQTSGVALDATGNVYIADQYNHRVRIVSPGGIINTFAGTGTFGFSGDGSNATAAELGDPSGVAVDAAGNVYIADYSKNRIRMVNTSGIISTVAGNGGNGYNGDGISATTAELSGPTGVAVDSHGNIFISDVFNQRVRKVNASGIISTVAGTGTAGYNGDGINATSAFINSPYGLAVDPAGNLYIGDYNNVRLRMVNTSGIISTVAGIATGGFSGDGGAATAAEVNSPIGVASYSTNIVYIADNGNQRIRRIGPNTSGINELMDNNDLLVYPNPANTQLSLQFTQISGKVSVKIYTLLGQKVLDIETENKNIITLEVGELSPGLYLLKAQSENGKLIVKRINIVR
ncbi:MAG TPA: T9SS type A sorting domain-containing protein [Bacteroidia bacterium]|jgi:sugar lactone lactonase YvrE|nr:T9SS type A sorting domain-containing protein [Bacteroidia bacterium]